MDVATGAGDRRGGRRPVLDDLEYNDSESPAIGLVPAGVRWEHVQNHIKIAHHPLLVLWEGSAQYAGGLLGRHENGHYRGPRIRSRAGDLRIP